MCRTEVILDFIKYFVIGKLNWLMPHGEGSAGDADLLRTGDPPAGDELMTIVMNLPLAARGGKSRG
jgi:hypothetical protein